VIFKENVSVQLYIKRKSNYYLRSTYSLLGVLQSTAGNHLHNLHSMI